MGLRRIACEVIYSVRSFEQALSYKEISDLVTEKNYQLILDEISSKTGPVSEGVETRGSTKVTISDQ